MAGVNTFSVDVSKWCGESQKKLELVVKKIAFELFTLIVKRSPVDTGRFRANNQVSVNSLPRGSVLEFDKSGRATISNGESEIGSYKPGDVIYIYNNVSYSVALEHGHSDQAPSGVYRVSVEDLVGRINNVVRSVK